MGGADTALALGPIKLMQLNETKDYLLKPIEKTRQMVLHSPQQLNILAVVNIDPHYGGAGNQTRR
jgi:hypothetical protein